ncbi:hypothetical protein NKG95_31495 [Mesorhizobium sp. M1423]|uniref:hypothetical protein n=1 Tax=Mesorhizobium sp. M1423 TaxID=2957101 RepID=UPI0033381843
MDPQPYRFVPSADRLERLFSLYEQARRAEGSGTTLHRVSPGQRVDAVVVMLGLNASSGWRRNGDENAEDLWLRYLTPVLAETRESAAALAAAVAECLPGTFDPPINQTTIIEEKTTVVTTTDELGTQITSSRWRRRIAIWLEDARNVLLDRRVIAMLAVVVATAVAAAVYFYWPTRPEQVVATTLPAITGNNGQGTGSGNGSNAGPGADNSDQAGDDYRAALALTLGAIQQNDGAITPRLLARIYAGESDMLSEPAIFLSAMLREWPLPPDAAIPRDGAGRWALLRYAATFVAVERKTRPLYQAPPLDSGTVGGTRLQQALDSFAVGEQVALSQQPAADRWPDWLRWLAFLPLLPALVWSTATFVSATKASLVNAGRQNRGAPAFLPVDSMAEQTALPPERRVARQISWREPVPGRRLDSERSIRATLAHGGYLTPVARLCRQSADYVFLVRRQHRNDHERDRASRLIDALVRGGVPLDIYDYDPDPRWLSPRSARPHATRAAPAATEKRSATPTLDLRGLRELHPDARLVLVTDGTELIDYFTQRPLPFVAGELATWPKRMLLTPVPMGEWGEREMNLADALGAVVGRATVEGFRDLVKVFGDRPRSMPLPEKIMCASAYVDTTARPARLLAPFNEASLMTTPDLNAFFKPFMISGYADVVDEAGLVPRPVPAVSGHEDLIKRLVAWLSASTNLLGGYDSFAGRPQPLRFDDPSLTSDAEPPAEQRDAVIAALRAWLGPRGFQWLAACAFYPQLRFAITLYLGLKITIQRGPIAQPLYDETLLAQLTLLPWFRTGHMPPWLRRSLAAVLPEAASNRARAAVSTMLGEQATVERTDLTIWRLDNRGLDIPPDEVMADLMMRDIDDAITPSVSGKAFKELFGKHINKALLLRVGLLAGTALWCAGAAYFWPAPGASPHPNGAWFALSTYCAATTVLPLLRLVLRAFLQRKARV